MDTNHFLTHKDEKIKQVAINLLATPYEYSTGWVERFEKPMNQKDPEDNFTKDSVYSLTTFKRRKVGKILNEIGEKIKVAQEEKNDKKLISLIKKQMKFKKIEQELAKLHNIVVWRMGKF